jgi:hypothetical protein
MFRRVGDALSHMSSHHQDYPIRYYSSFKHNIYAQNLHHNQQYVLENAANGGHTYAVKHTLSLLPPSPQITNDSPFTDYALFIFDEKSLVTQER